MVVFEKGELLSLSYRNHRGPEALPDILKFSSGTYSFTDGLLGHQQDDLPTVEEFARMLRESDGGGASPAGGGGTFKNPDLLEQHISALLMEYVGPISSVLCENTLEEVGGVGSVADANNFVAKLSREIADQGEREQFTSKAGGIIKMLK